LALLKTKCAEEGKMCKNEGLTKEKVFEILNNYRIPRGTGNEHFYVIAKRIIHGTTFTFNPRYQEINNWITEYVGV